MKKSKVNRSSAKAFGLTEAFMFIFFLIFLSGHIFAHEVEYHTTSSFTPPQSEVEDHQHDNHDDSSVGHPHAEGKVTADLDDFPNLHPLVVHFPIVLLILAAILGLANIFFLKRELNWVLTIVIFAAALGAYAAGRWYHPHAHELTEQAKQVLGQHDLYASWTIYLSITALIAQALHQFVIQSKRWSMIVVAVILLGAAYAVGRAGHYGSQLVYIEGVGPQGDFLETGDHEH